MQHAEVTGGPRILWAPIGKRNVAELDPPGDRRHLASPELVFDLRRRVQQLQHPLAARHSRLHGRVELAQLLDRLKEARYIGQEGDDDAEGDLVARYREPAEP